MFFVRYTYGGAQPGRTSYQPSYYYRPSHSVYPAPVRAPAGLGYGGHGNHHSGAGGGLGLVGGGYGGGLAQGGYAGDDIVELRGLGGGHG